MKICLAGAGAFGIKHIEALAQIDDVEVASLVGRMREPTEEVARKFGIPHVATDLAESLARADIDAVILATPTQLHASQALACLDAGKHVQIEIPLADNLAAAEAVARRQRETGLVAMVGHTRRFNPSHQWIHERIVGGELNLQQMDVQTYFFRRTQHQRAGAAALVDRSPALAPCRAHGRPLRVADRRDCRRRTRCRDPFIRSSASRWTCRSR